MRLDTPATDTETVGWALAHHRKSRLVGQGPPYKGATNRHSRFPITTVLAIALLAALPKTASAVDPPHWGDTTDCGTCHTFHQAEGAALTAFASNANLCQSCHNASGSAQAMPMNTNEMAIPGVLGIHHAWETEAVNATYGAQAPLNTAMSLRVMDGKVVCSTCHNQHGAMVDTETTSGRPHISQPVKTNDLLGTGTIASSGAYSGAEGIRYLIQIESAGSAATAIYRWSKDGGMSWMATGVAASATPTALDFGVMIAFTGGAGNAFKAAEEFQFHGTYPFLRATLDQGDNSTGVNFCRDCHRDWVMDHTDSAGNLDSWDGTYKSHPVGVAMGANSKGYDRATPLDTDGLEQGSSGDTNASNDLRLDSGGLVQCISCHAVHYADSNSQTEDGP